MKPAQKKPVIAIPMAGEGKPRRCPSIKAAAKRYGVSVCRVSTAIRDGDFVFKCRRFFDYAEVA